MTGDRSTMRVKRPEALPGVELLDAMLVDPPSVRHLHGDYRFAVSLAGGFAARYGRRDFEVAPGRIQIAQPGEVSMCSFAPGSAHAFRVVSVPAAQVAQLCGELSRSPDGLPDFAEHLMRDDDAAAHFLAAHDRLMQAESALESGAILCDLLGLMIRRFASEPARLPSLLAPRAMALVRDHIEAHLDRNPSLAELAALAEVSPFHLNRSFRAAFGLPPHAYQNHRRIERAKPLLAAGLPGGDVAHDLGFADQSHFIRQFRKQLGLTPQRYRASLVD